MTNVSLEKSYVQKKNYYRKCPTMTLPYFNSKVCQLRSVTSAQREETERLPCLF